MKNLKMALHSFLTSEKLEQLAAILEYSSHKKRISFDKIEEIIKGDPEDVLFISNEWGLLYPVKTFKSSSWEDRVLFAKSGEVYEMPNIIRHLVKNALKTGKWDIKFGVVEIFREMGESKCNLMPQLIDNMKSDSMDYTINAQQIKKICIELGLANKLGALIAELKAAGVISPKLGSSKNVFKAHSPIYEINRSLFINE